MIGAGFFHRVAAITVLLQGLVATGIAQTTEPVPRVSTELVSVAKIWDQAPHNA
eukprot:COSAG04_NODE_5229_length_1694_cov_1.338558_1_plen_53_part_10